MAPRRFHDLDARPQEVFAQIGDAAEAVLQIIFLEHFLKALGHRLQVASAWPP